jgi:Zn-dependent peptidase ImmA (M78 family)
MTKLPKSVKIGGSLISIKKNELEDAEFGKYHNHKSLIEVSNSIDDQQIKLTVFHEILHAIFFERGLRHSISKEQEEILVSALESAIYSFIKDNPKFVKYLMEA